MTNLSIVTEYVSGLKTGQVVSLYNLASVKPVTKFATREIANQRTISSMADYPTFFGDYAISAAQIGLGLPSPDAEVETPKASKSVVEKKSKASKSVSAEEPKIRKNARLEGSEKQSHIAHINLRCPICNYMAKTNVEFDAIARIKCPVHPKQSLLTREERNEKSELATT